ncbi:MAG: ATP-binding cassette domain-containing protein [Pedobacter sp.]|nr:ATP-binding cassette domain-containing protein [Pedobacter sp.]
MSGLYVDSVTKDFGLRQVLSDIFITCQLGEIIGLLGRNGSGKSTLLKIIFGALKADHKFVKVNDKHIRSLYDSRNLIQYLPQDSFLPSHISIKKVISVFCDQEQAAKLFEMELIKPFLHHKSNDLSGGEKRLIEIFILLYSKAKYVLLDEPFNGLAPLHIEIIKDKIRELAPEKGFIISDHDYNNVLAISTSIILLHDGETKKIKDHQELIDFGYLPSDSLTR